MNPWITVSFEWWGDSCFSEAF